MKGVWWSHYNCAPEELVTLFSDAEFNGTFNEDGTDGYGEWKRPLKKNWSRHNSLQGLVFSIIGKSPTREVVGRMNLKDGMCTVRKGKGGSGAEES